MLPEDTLFTVLASGTGLLAGIILLVLVIAAGAGWYLVKKKKA